MGNIHDTTAFTFFIKLGIVDIPKMSGYLGDFPKVWVSGKFPQYPGFCEIPQIFEGGIVS